MAINISPQSSIHIKIPTKFRLRARTDHSHTHTHTNARTESSERMEAFHTVFVGSLNLSVATKKILVFGFWFFFLFCLDVNNANVEMETMHYLRAVTKVTAADAV